MIVNTSLDFRIKREGRIEDELVFLKRMLNRKLILGSVSYAKVRLRNGVLDLALKAQ